MEGVSFDNESSHFYVDYHVNDNNGGFGFLRFYETIDEADKAFNILECDAIVKEKSVTIKVIDMKTAKVIREYERSYFKTGETGQDIDDSIS